MNVLITILLCFVPLLVTAALCKAAIGVKAVHILLSSFLGLVAVLPILFIQLFIGGLQFFNAGSFLSAIVRSLVFNGLVEEVLKTAVIFLLPVRRLKLKNLLACAMLVGLSLGCFESSVYFLRDLHLNGGGLSALYAQIFLRMVTADLIHLSCTGLCGIFAWALFRKKVFFFPVAAAVFAHGIYNFFSMYTTGIRFFAVAAIFFAAVECRVQYVRVREETIEVSGIGDT